MPSNDRDVETLMTSDGNDELSDAASSDDQQSLSDSERDPAKGVNRDRDRLDQRRVLDLDPGRKPDQAARVDPDLIGQAAVQRDTVHPLNDRAAELILPGRTEITLT